MGKAYLWFGHDADGSSFCSEGDDPFGLDSPVFLNSPEEAFLVQKASEVDAPPFEDGFPVQDEIVDGALLAGSNNKAVFRGSAGYNSRILGKSIDQLDIVDIFCGQDRTRQKRQFKGRHGRMLE